MKDIGLILDTRESEKILARLNDLHPRVIDLSLDRIYQLLKKLENPHKKIPPVIHIAGTNGKGSTLSFIKAGLEANGDFVHSYISPHLKRFNERIKIRGKEIDEALLSEYLLHCEKSNLGESITIFEITTCAAFLAFSKTTADYTLLEVGLGGRLDATNVIKSPLLSIITPVSMDHEKFLGNTIEKIAFEKAGILKTDSLGIIGKQSSEVQRIIDEQARSLNVPLSVYGRDWVSKKYKEKLVYEDNDGAFTFPSPTLVGDHQFENAGIAITALKSLRIKKKFSEKGLLTVDWPARLQKLKTGPLIDCLRNLSYTTELWIDGGHNKAAAKAISQFLTEPFCGKSHVICGMINSKDVKAFLSEIKGIPESIVCVRVPNEHSSLTAKQIFVEARRVNPNSFTAQSLDQAIQHIVSQNSQNKGIRILICGSLYLSGYILRNHS